MFMGTYEHTIDDKGRIIIPSRFREELGESFVMTKGLDNCLFVYPLQEWAQLEQELKALPFTRADARAFVRFFFSGASECTVDKQGRVVIPSTLREYAQLEREAVVVGISSRVEVWSRDGWRRYEKEAELSYEDIAEKIVDLEL